MLLYNSTTNLLTYRDNAGWKELSSLTGNNAFTGNNTFSGTSTFSNTATFSNSAVFNSTLKLPTAAPGSPTAGMVYFNTTNNLLTVRNSANTGYVEFSSLSGNNTFTGNNTFSGTNAISGNLNVSGNTTLSGNLSISGNTTMNGTTTVNGEVTMNSRLVIPMAQLSFFNTSGITTNINSTAWNSTTAATNWNSIIFPSRGSTMGTNTIVDSISTLGARVNHNNSGNGAAVVAYKGSISKIFNISYTISFQGTSSNGNNHDELVFGIFKNNVLIPASIYFAPNEWGYKTATIQVLTTLNQNDWVDLRVIGFGGSSSTTVTIFTGKMTAFGL